MPRTPVFLAIRSGLLRNSIKEALKDVPDLEVAGEAQDVEGARQALESDCDCLILLGATLAGQLPVPIGAFADERVRVVLIVSPFTPTEQIGQYTVQGAKGIATSDIRMTDLIRMLQLVSRGMMVFPATDLEALDRLPQPALDPGIGEVRLTKRERELLQLVAQGFSEKEASSTLGIGQRTAQTYLERIRAKLHAENRVHATALAVAAHLISVPAPSAEKATVGPPVETT